MPYKTKEARNAASNRRYHANPEKFAKVMKDYYRKDIKGRLLSSAKYRAKKQGIPFDISVDDFDIPEFCPIFPHIPIIIGEGKHCFTSPSLDRIIPDLGYVKGNVQIISYRANRMKNDGTLQELIMMGEWANQILNR